MQLTMPVNRTSASFHYLLPFYWLRGLFHCFLDYNLETTVNVKLFWWLNITNISQILNHNCLDSQDRHDSHDTLRSLSPTHPNYLLIKSHTHISLLIIWSYIHASQPYVSHLNVLSSFYLSLYTFLFWLTL